jgi:translocation and assembly module TamA
VVDKQKLRTGDILHHGRYDEVKQALIDEATRMGYFDARFLRSEVLVHPEENAADIFLSLKSGPRYRINRINVNQDSLRPELVKAYVKLNEGDWYTARAVNQTYENLSSSGYFSRVLVQPDLETRNHGALDIKVDLEPADRRIIETGVGYATDTGPRLRGDLKYKRLNSRGHRSDTSLLLSPVQSDLSTNYAVPYGDPTYQWLVYSAGIAFLDTDTSKSRKYALGARRASRRFGDWTESLFVEARYEDFEVGSQNDTSRLVLLGSTWSRIKSAGGLRARSGERFNLGIRGGATALGSDTDFVQFTAEAKAVRSVGRARFIARLDAGTTVKDSLEDLPPSIRFFAGGDSSVRGYDFETLGPEKNGEVVGGSHLLTGTLELDWRAWKNWAVAVFADSGSAFNDEPDFSTGIGAGVRWFSPVGPVRVDFAHPLDAERSLRVHISLGPDL